MSNKESRTGREWLLLFLKGSAMGAADVVPGVSGGTVAFISGIYQELLASIKSVNLAALKTLINDGPAAFWAHINGQFLLVLFSGLLLSYISLAHIVSYVMLNHPILLWSFFFGLIIASIIYIFRGLNSLTLSDGTMMVVGTLIAVTVYLLPSMVVNDGLLVVFVSAAVAICAMILPGVSGSFILLLLGMYPIVIDAVTDFNVTFLSVFLLGCIAGLMSFSRLLSWLLTRFYNKTISLLTGFLMGSLLIVWPWKEVLEVMIDSKGREIVLSSRVLWPHQYGYYTGTDPLLIPAIGLMVFGVVLVLGLEYLGSNKKG